MMKYFIFMVLAFSFAGIASATFLNPVKAVPVEKVLVVSAVAIANGQTSTAAIPTSGLSLVGVQLPAAFTGTTLTFTGSVDGTTYQPVYSTTSGTALSYTVAQGHYVAIDPVAFYGLAYIKLVSGSAEGGARAFSVALKGL
jgi:hypothetical protein